MGQETGGESGEDGPGNWPNVPVGSAMEPNSGSMSLVCEGSSVVERYNVPVWLVEAESMGFGARLRQM